MHIGYTSELHFAAASRVSRLVTTCFSPRRVRVRGRTRIRRRRVTFTPGVKGVKEVVRVRVWRVVRRARSMFDAGSHLNALVPSAVGRSELKLGMGLRKGCRHGPARRPTRGAPPKGRKCRKYATEVGLSERSSVFRGSFRTAGHDARTSRSHRRVACTLGYPTVCVGPPGAPSF